MKRRVAFFVADVLPFSTPYFRMQALALSRYEARFLGIRRREDVALPEDRVTVLLEHRRRHVLQELSLFLLGYAPRLERVLREWKPHLIHAHFGPNAAVIYPLARRLNIPMVITFHGYDATVSRPLFFRHALYLWRRRALKKYVSRFLTVSNFLRDHLLRQGFPPDRVVVHPWGIDPNVFPPPLPRHRRDPVILSVGRLVPVKGLHTLVRALAKVRSRHPIRWRVIGDGPLRQTLEAEARSLGVHAEFLGVLPHEQVLKEMARAQILAIPSEPQTTGEEEGFGMVFLEAMACGTPVIGTWSGGIPEVVQDGVTGLLVPPGNVEALAEAVQRLLEDSSLWQVMMSRGPERVKQHFSLQKHIEHLENIYDHVLEEHRHDLASHSR